MIEQRRKRVRLATTSCPQCSEIGGLKKIIFGMPSADFDHERFIADGYSVSRVKAEGDCSVVAWGSEFLWKGNK